MTPCKNSGRLGNSGEVSIVAILVGLFVISGAIIVTVQHLKSLRESSRQHLEVVIAENYASELLEFFASLDVEGLRTYLNQNPINPGGLSRYYLCSHINLLDRGNQVVLNEDPVASLDPNNPLNEPGSTNPANRFYIVQVVDKTTLAIDKNRCSDNSAPIAVLGANETFLVTAGVSWVPKGQPLSAIKRVVLTTLLPNVSGEGS